MTQKKYQNSVEKNSPVSFQKETTIGVEGYAPVVYYPKTIEELVGLIQELTTPYYVIGNGSNVLPPKNSSRVMIKTTKLSFIKESSAFFSCGTSVAKLLQFFKKGYTGGEFLAGIPATVGGLLYMNGGAGGRYISSIVQGVVAYEKGEIIYLPQRDCRYAYKHSRFMEEGGVILGGYLTLKKEDPQIVEERIKSVLERRKHLPEGRSMGCVFKNPIEKSAGKLIEGANLKGLRIGGAYVSKQHANFIIAGEDATREDIISLIERVKREVYQTYQIRLEEEIRYIP